MPAPDRYSSHRFRMSQQGPLPVGFSDKRDSFGMVYASIVPFALAEYGIEAWFETAPSALVFPFGYLLFWAFYYTYYKPGLLEDRMASAEIRNPLEIPSLILGVSLWFVRVTFVELIDFILVRPLGGSRKSAANPRPKRRAPPKTHHRPVEHVQTPSLPFEVLQALRVMGLDPHCNWETVHRRYRELAKRYHPDLHPEATGGGARFMQLDIAYKKLTSVKHLYFRD